jgi:hypothetical protein
MNPFTVDWTDDAIAELTTIWMQASDPDEVTAAQATIDSLLARAPLHHGTEVSEGLRALVVPPLRVLYSVDQTTRHVEVSLVKRVS